MGLVSCLLLLSCTGGTDSFRGRTIKVWESYANEEHDVFVKIAQSFEEEYEKTTGEKVRVKVERMPFDQSTQKIKFASITGTAPDIARIDAGELIDLVYGQVVMDLETIDPDVDSYLRTFTAPARETVRIPLRQPDGSIRTGIYGIPDQITGVAVYYNRTLLRQKGLAFPPGSLKDLEKAEPRWTFAKFAEYALKMKNPEESISGLGLNKSLWFSLPFFNAFGAEFIAIQPDGTFKCVLTEDSGIAALTAIASLTWNGAEGGAWRTGALDPDKGFLNGKYGMIVSGPWKLKEFENAGLDFGVALIPEGPVLRDIETPQGTVRVGTSTNVGGSDMAIIKTTREPKLCYEFLKYITRPDVHARWCNELGQIPVQTLAEPMVDFSKNPNLAVFMEQMRTAKPRPKMPRYGVLESQIMVPQIERAFGSGSEQGVRDALEYAVKEIDRLILADVNIPR